MRTYYRGSDAVITETQFVWYGRTARIFAIDSIDNLRLVRTSVAPPRRAELAFGLAMFGAALATWLVLGPYVAAPLTVIAVVLTLIGVSRPGTQAQEIRATYRGHETTVYSSGDPQVFNQVAQALRHSIQRRAAGASLGLLSG